MKNKYIFESERLGFRRWDNEDKIAFAKMNANLDVMEYFPNALSKNESDAFLDRIENHIERYGYGLWAVEIKSNSELIGFIGFSHPKFEEYFTPCVEIGWRIDQKFWNNGYATEAAKICLKYGFEKLKFDKIYSFTAKINKKSINVMNKIGLEKESEFNHPSLNEESELRLHVLYSIRNK